MGGGAGLGWPGHWAGALAGGTGLAGALGGGGAGAAHKRPTEAASQAGSWLLSEAHQPLPDVKNPPDTNSSERRFTASPAFRLPPPGAPVPRGGPRSKASVSSRARTIHSRGLALGWGRAGSPSASPAASWLHPT